MKNATSTPNKLSKESWWKFSLTTWQLIIGLVLLNIGCFLKPTLLDTLLKSLFNVVDIRTWAWWYFICLIIVVGFSIRWYLLYQTYKNNDFDPLSSEEAKWFCMLSGTITFLGIVFIFLHRFSLLRWLFNPLYLWFGVGTVSFASLLLVISIFAVVGFLVFLICKWVDVLLATYN
ncbi:MAG: hypothetical protein LBC74_05125 [Planctomycetaceae bacterium]|jgi:hypothetical protein|nr:hypothetical protein [Planctomycetaceae bacterium]